MSIDNTFYVAIVIQDFFLELNPVHLTGDDFSFSPSQELFILESPRLLIKLKLVLSSEIV
ncbi:MAG TPA: hypothetical protein DEF48_03170 [Nostoc sp. UBA8866]|nr:hypothetical protein [Nostoc sp. UBA8866]